MAGFGSKRLITHEHIGFQEYRVDHKMTELIDNTNPQYVQSVLESFDNIIGYFEDRAKESFDIFYWIKAISNSPKTIANFVIDIVKYMTTGK